MSFMDELDLSWSDLGGTVSDAFNEVASGWAAGKAAEFRGDDGQRPQQTTADRYDQTVVTPTDGSAQGVANRIAGTFDGMGWWVLGAIGVTLAAVIYSRS